MRRTDCDRPLFLAGAAFLAALAWPAVAWANGGTSLMWFSMLHLLIGNFFVGIGEAVVLRILFKAPWARAIGFMVVANYFSMIAGTVFIDRVSPACGSGPAASPPSPSAWGS